MYEFGGSKTRRDGVLPGASWRKRVTLVCGPTPYWGETSDLMDPPREESASLQNTLYRRVLQELHS